MQKPVNGFAMTLVSAFMIGEHPYLVGDFLISSSASTKNSLSLPTSKRLTFEALLTGQPVPTGLRQKIVILSDHLAIGWSDSMIDARSLIREISEEFTDLELSGDEVVAFLKGKESEYSNVNLVGVCKKDNRRYIFYFNGALKISHPVLKNFYAIGSGSPIFANYSQTIPISAEDHTQSTLSIVSMMGALLGEELRSQSTLLNNFGGGFEIIYHDGKQFKKFDETTYLFWSAHEHSDRKVYVTGLPIFIKYKAIGDLCIVRRSFGKREDCSEDRVPNITTELFPINPVLRTPTEDELTAIGVPSLNSNLQCHYMVGHLQDGSSLISSVVQTGSRGFQFEEQNGDLLITPSDDVLNILQSKIADYVRNHYQK